MPQVKEILQLLRGRKINMNPHCTRINMNPHTQVSHNLLFQIEKRKMFERQVEYKICQTNENKV
jgi:hypothetical protein